MKNGTLVTGLFRRLFRKQDGTILMEFAYTFPIILMLLIGGFETFRILLIERKVNQTVNAVSNLVSQNEILPAEMITDTFDAVDNVMAPFDINSGGRVIVSRFKGTPSGTLITDQCISGNGIIAESKFGNQNEYADLENIPGTFTLADDEIAIVAEVFFRYEPMFVDLSFIFPTNLYQQRQVYQISVHKPRFGDTDFTEGCPA
ncbi:TadE/TadG family type IV pilus assembly protein [Emcibacter nanhaiensis]|uniref:Pilus assembly protein n=1 Tax=Emcibacter nanhaiensis TaxID=1505037 RepID=A0A501PBH5_9PROT|nr:TadE/TadG family type IV pilus assembly protein [Emcibacter nanhaiensis]TPD57723.1 pilus assembly protein [Emcibacter nanhaiensis]